MKYEVYERVLHVRLLRKFGTKQMAIQYCQEMRDMGINAYVRIVNEEGRA